MSLPSTASPLSYRRSPSLASTAWGNTTTGPSSPQQPHFLRHQRSPDALKHDQHACLTPPPQAHAVTAAPPMSYAVSAALTPPNTSNMPTLPNPPPTVRHDARTASLPLSYTVGSSLMPSITTDMSARPHPPQAQCVVRAELSKALREAWGQREAAWMGGGWVSRGCGWMWVIVAGCVSVFVANTA